ncbi:lasso peptide biosynthesis PqqD family chaperone [Cytobacillus sp. S13-E01]|uniref:lasso peptide biosynthesis PqqD family chaperone n=1 Tax=Cytobacillus sp. S13-E01 TaxID=3031326 RepID=UPI0023D7CBFF|nr:lasso peptide biosynthesis PqqD family chaperone [Cytobacillus sp. S13-E01]MDF0727753.1 lasso peptide biosynthesis PqqD family chaperone [Cytobacillus sp. S13-E01]
MLIKDGIVLSNKVTQVEGNIVSDMDGEKVMLSIINGKYYNLGEIGGVIWDHMNEPMLVENLITILTKGYEIEKSECEVQVISFLNHLLKEGLINTSKE